MAEITQDGAREHLLSVKDLKTYFHTSAGISKAVDGVSFTLDRGKTLGIVGESGSGKSVTASSVIRLLPKTGSIESGEIEFDGKDMVNISMSDLLEIRGKDIAMIYQDPMTSLDPVFKVGSQMIELIRAHENVSKEEARKRSIEMLRLVGIPEPERRMDSYPYELSGGMCQRVIIAMAMSLHPKFIIADEPTTALDVTVQSQVLDLLQGSSPITWASFGRWRMTSWSCTPDAPWSTPLPASSTPTRCTPTPGVSLTPCPSSRTMRMPTSRPFPASPPI